ncbi:MAG: AAA family ATPase [Bacteroidia bacterium]
MKKGHKPLIVRGARQVGKSTTIRQFGKKYDCFLEINLEKQADNRFFENEENVNRIIEAIAFSKGKIIVPHKTLLFIDEIQENPKAIQWLRYFYEDQTDVDVIAAGSLLEFAISQTPSFPVGRIEQMVLHPFSFEEFLMAIGDVQALTYFNQIPFDALAYNKLLDYFNRYILVGGMPEVVANYVESNQSLLGLNEIYASIWESYLDDAEKYAKNDTEAKVLRHILKTAPFVRDRFSFNGFGNSNYRSREVGEALSSLDKSRLIKIIYPTTDTLPPLLNDFKRKPRLQFLDTGLLNFASGNLSEMLYIKDFAAYQKGFFVQHIVYQEIIASTNQLGFSPQFWVRENAKSNAEVDLVLAHKNFAIPVEIKSGAKGHLRSLHEFMNVSNHPYSVRLLANNPTIELASTAKQKTFWLYNLPYFLASKLNQHIDWLINEKPNVRV